MLDLNTAVLGGTRASQGVHDDDTEKDNAHKNDSNDDDDQNSGAV